MAVIRRSPLDPYPVTQKYLTMRSRALHIPPAQFSGIKFDKDDVYGVIIDIPMGRSVLATLVCFINGAANLYFNNGGEYTGASMRYKAVVQAARTLVANAGPLKAKAERTVQFPLPVGGTQFVYMLTKRGTFLAQINPRTLTPENREAQVVYYLCQQVMGELRVAQMRDKEDLPEGGKKHE